MRVVSWPIAVLLALAPVTHGQGISQATFGSVPPQTNSGTGFTGAPYSGKQTTVTVRMLEDGTTTTQTFVELLWRDAQGRTRREMIRHNAIGGEFHSIIITDPVAGVYLKWETGNEQAGQIAGIWPITPQQRVTSPAQSAPTARANPDSPVTMPNLERETLAPEFINGVHAEGTRTVRTIPLEEESSNRQIKVTNELWISPDLRIIVRHILDDPRSGQTTTNLTDIVRDNPDPTLFQPPAGYTVAGHTKQISR